MLLLPLLLLPLVGAARRPPHLVLVIADDLGFHDVPWHNSKVDAPTLRWMAEHGTILNRSYAQPTCTPSRASLLTGLYAHRTGLQHGPLGDLQPTGLPEDLVLLPERLRAAGYASHLVGKWHLGFCRWSMTPTRRGFDSFFGFLSGLETHDTHESFLVTNHSVRGLDLWHGERPVVNLNGTYSSYAFAARAEDVVAQHPPGQPLLLVLSMQQVHEPLQAPRRFVRRYPGLPLRRAVYLGMMSALDEALGRVVEALRQADMLEDALFVVTSDNGGKRGAGSSNWPLRGFKDSLWEGGMRVPALVFGRGVPARTETGLVHISDWVPTFLDLAGLPWRGLGLDGVSHAQTIFRGRPSARRQAVLQVDERANNAAILRGRHKLVVGSPEYCRAWYPHAHCHGRVRALRAVGQWLFDVEEDPGETKNLAAERPDLVQRLQRRLEAERARVRPSVEKPNSLAGLPANWGGMWSPGWC